MKARLPLALIAIMLFISGVVFAGTPPLTTNTISPLSTYEYLPTTFSVNIISAQPINQIVWGFNGVVVYTDNVGVANAITSGVFNYTAPAYNGVANVVVYANVIDGNYLSDNVSNTIVYNKYVLPSLTSILPTATKVNETTTFYSTITQGSFSVNTIEWEIANKYFTDTAYTGVNFQAYSFNSAYPQITITAQVCDLHLFCTSTSQNVHVASLIPSSYWRVSNFTSQGSPIPGNNSNYNIPYQTLDRLTLYFTPQNDTNRIQSVIINWGDGSPNLLTNYTSAVTQDTYQHQWPLGTFVVKAQICDIMQNCNVSTIFTVHSVQTLQGTIANFLVNQNPNTNTVNLAASLWSDISAFGSNLLAIFIGIILVIGIVYFGGSIAMGRLRKKGWIK